MSDVCAHGWSSVLEEMTASQQTLAQLSEEADACRSETDDSDSLPDNSLWWVNLLKKHCSGYTRPQPPKRPITVLSACSASCADLMVLKAGLCCTRDSSHRVLSLDHYIHYIASDCFVRVRHCTNASTIIIQ